MAETTYTPEQLKEYEAFAKKHGVKPTKPTAPPASPAAKMTPQESDEQKFFARVVRHRGKTYGGADY